MYSVLQKVLLYGCFCLRLHISVLFKKIFNGKPVTIIQPAKAVYHSSFSGEDSK